MNFRNRCVRSRADTDLPGEFAVGIAFDRRFRSMREERAHAWHAFLQQQFGRLELRIGQKAALHRLLEQTISQSQQTHSLVVCHMRPNDGKRVFAGHS